MNRHALVGQNLMDRQKPSQHFVRRNQVDFSKRFTSGDYLGSVLIARVKRRTPVERVREDQPHFFFGAPWR
jgi:hypothetical protein